MTSSLLMQLEFDDEDLHIRTTENIPADKNKINLSTSHQLNPEEERILTLLVREWRFASFLYHEDTDFHENHFTPPTGFAATFNRDCTFQPHLFEQCFRVFSMCSVEYEGRISQEEIIRWKRALNATIRDESPNPPIYGESEPSGPWSPSLGPLSWIGVGNYIHSKNGVGPLCVYVVCGPDQATMDHLQDLFYYHRNKPFKDVEPIFTWCRDVVKENARRLLHVATTHMLLPTAAKVVTWPSTAEKRIISKGEWKWLTECGVEDPSTIYAGFYPPTFKVLECPKMNEEELEQDNEDDVEFDRHPHSIIPEIEIMLDDIVPYPHEQNHLVRLSGCCALEGKVARVKGPSDEIRIYNVAQSTEPAFTKRWLHSFPAQSNLRVGLGDGPLRKPKLDFTWENEELKTNPYLSRFQFRLRDMALLNGVDHTPGSITIQPQLIRVTTKLPPYVHDNRELECKVMGVVS